MHTSTYTYMYTVWHDMHSATDVVSWPRPNPRIWHFRITVLHQDSAKCSDMVRSDNLYCYSTVLFSIVSVQYCARYSTGTKYTVLRYSTAMLQYQYSTMRIHYW